MDQLTQIEELMKLDKMSLDQLKQSRDLMMQLVERIEKRIKIKEGCA